MMPMLDEHRMPGSLRRVGFAAVVVLAVGGCEGRDLGPVSVVTENPVSVVYNPCNGMFSGYYCDAIIMALNNMENSGNAECIGYALEFRARMEEGTAGYRTMPGNFGGYYYVEDFVAISDLAFSHPYVENTIAHEMYHTENGGNEVEAGEAGSRCGPA